MTITAAADGSALGNPGPAGWAWYVDDSCWAAGGWKHATNNQGELKAVLELFRATAHLDEDLLVLCDSQYVINSVTKWMPGWKKKGWRKGDGKPVMNLDLLKEIDQALIGRRYRFEWVKGHANHPLNEAADERARAVAEAYQRSGTIPAGPGWARIGDPASPTAAVPAAAVAAAAAPVATDAAAVPVDAVPVDDVPVATDAAAVPAAAVSAAAAPVATDAAAVPVDAVPVDDEEREDDAEPFEQPGLFSFDAPEELHTVELTLTANEHDRLTRRARLAGVSTEELVRSLI